MVSARGYTFRKKYIWAFTRIYEREGDAHLSDCTRRTKKHQQELQVGAERRNFLLQMPHVPLWRYGALPISRHHAKKQRKKTVGTGKSHPAGYSKGSPDRTMDVQYETEYFSLSWIYRCFVRGKCAKPCHWEICGTDCRRRPSEFYGMVSRERERTQHGKHQLPCPPERRNLLYAYTDLSAWTALRR